MINRNTKLWLLVLSFLAFNVILHTALSAQGMIKVIKVKDQQKIDVYIGDQLFTSLLFDDSLSKPVLYPINASSGVMVTRGFPLNTQKDDPTDHPHHLGLWFNFENVNGLDFWNNSYIIPKEKKHLYGSIITDTILNISSGKTGTITYHANWENQKKDTLLEEITQYEFSAKQHIYIIDRTTTITAKTDVLFKDSKDGLLGMRVAHELQIPSMIEKKFVDDKGIVTIVKADNIIPTGNYLNSEGKIGDSIWGNRAKWCKMYGKIKTDSVSIVIMDHPQNPNYPSFWHARGYGLFAANPFGENTFTKGRSTSNLSLKNNESVSFRYRIVIANGTKSLSNEAIEKLVQAFEKHQ